MGAIVCGWCHARTFAKRFGKPATCETCGRDPVLPWTQRGQRPPVWKQPILPKE